MFHLLGKTVTRFWPIVLVTWIAVVAGVWLVAPDFHSVVADGEFAYLPPDAPSRLAEQKFETSFGAERELDDDSRVDRDIVGSSIVVVVRRPRGDGLRELDKRFIEEKLATEIVGIAEEEGGLAAIGGDESADGESSEQSVIARVRTPSDKAIGNLLISEDGHAALVVVELTTEFNEIRNFPTVAKIEGLLDRLRRDSDLRKEYETAGLEMTVSGLAVVGRDMRKAAQQSASATESWTILLVVGLLVVIYRAPLLALIPLITVYLATKLSLSFLALLAANGIVDLFSGIEVYVTVILYGAGVDYCLFLVSRYGEELDRGATIDEALALSVEKVGAALAASAGTTICGIGMMYFAEFGKFSQAGVAIPLSLVFVLAAAITFTPALLRLFGRVAFWPKYAMRQNPGRSGWISPTSLFSRLLASDAHRRVWHHVGELVAARPATVWGVAFAVMAPFALVGILFYNHLSYGLLSELPDEQASVVGAEAVQKHFPAGATGPVTVLVESDSVSFGSMERVKKTEGYEAIARLTDELAKPERMEQLQIADVRSVSAPLGVNHVDEEPSGSGLLAATRRKAKLQRAIRYYVGGSGEREGHVTRLDIVFRDDPFSRNSIEQLDRLRQTLPELLPETLSRSKTSLAFLGATPSIRDLKRVTDRDQVRIDVLVLAGVFAILVILLRKPAISAYLILSVFFSYLVTLGVTVVVFYALDPAGFAGLDWKVPMFLFTILIAVGQDYNIYLITRVEEEQREHGTIDGITIALARTGGIISSCGVIMAGTFSSLMAGSLVGMHQLGFALAFGVLLDTFVVRPVLVPAYLVMLHSGRFGTAGRYLGANEGEYAASTPAATN